MARGTRVLSPMTTIRFEVGAAKTTKSERQEGKQQQSKMMNQVSSTRHSRLHDISRKMCVKVPTMTVQSPTSAHAHTQTRARSRTHAHIPLVKSSRIVGPLRAQIEEQIILCMLRLPSEGVKPHTRRTCNTALFRHKGAGAMQRCICTLRPW